MTARVAFCYSCFEWIFSTRCQTTHVASNDFSYSFHERDLTASLVERGCMLSASFYTLVARVPPQDLRWFNSVKPGHALRAHGKTQHLFFCICSHALRALFVRVRCLVCTVRSRFSIDALAMSLMTVKEWFVFRREYMAKYHKDLLRIHLEEDREWIFARELDGLDMSLMTVKEWFVFRREYMAKYHKDLLRNHLEENNEWIFARESRRRVRLNAISYPRPRQVNNGPFEAPAFIQLLPPDELSEYCFVAVRRGFKQFDHHTFLLPEKIISQRRSLLALVEISQAMHKIFLMHRVRFQAAYVDMMWGTVRHTEREPSLFMPRCKSFDAA